MKLLIAVDDIKQELGGVSSSMAILYQNLLSNKVDVKVGVSKSASLRGYSDFENNKIKLYYAKELIKLKQVEIVHNNGIWTRFSYTVMRNSFRNRIKTIQSVHGMLEPWSLNQGKFKKKLALFVYQKKILENADLIHASTLDEVRAIRANGITNKIAVIPNGIDIQSPLKINNKKPYKLLFLSRIHRKKGIELLLEALSFFKYKFELVIAGSGDSIYITKLKKDVERLGLTGIVSFVGYVSGKKKEDLFISSDFFVLPTYSENFGNVVAEALKYGKPVITTNKTPWSEIETQMSGYITTPSALSISKALKSISELSENEYADMQLNAFNHGKQYDIEVIGKKYLLTYQYLNGFSGLPDFIDA